MAVLLFAALPVEHCTPGMLSFRASAEPMRVSDNARYSRDGLPWSDNPEHLTIQHWQAGGVVLFGYVSLEAARHGKQLLEAVYVARSGRVAVRDRY